MYKKFFSNNIVQKCQKLAKKTKKLVMASIEKIWYRYYVYFGCKVSIILTRAVDPNRLID